MPAALQPRPRERLLALAAVLAIQMAVGLALIDGLRVSIVRPADVAQRLIAVALIKPPPPLAPPKSRPARAEARPRQEARGAVPAVPARAPPPPSVVAARPVATAEGRGGGVGSAAGRGSGGGADNGGGDGEGGTDLVQIAGAILPSDYPRHLRQAGLGGRVEMSFTVEPNGLVGRCTVTRSSGVPELDQLTCRLIQKRFRYRPSTDRFGRPIADEVDGEQDWVAR